MKRLIGAVLCMTLLAACQQPVEQADTPAPAPRAQTPVRQSPVDVSGSQPAPTVPGDAPHAAPEPLDVYSYEIKTRYPRAWAAWDRALRATPLERDTWLADFTGTASPIRAISVGGRAYHYGWVCKPHNCGNNQVGVLIAPDQSRIVGLVKLTNEDTNAVRSTPVGDPAPVEAACLTRLIEGEELAAC